MGLVSLVKDILISVGPSDEIKVVIIITIMSTKRE